MEWSGRRSGEGEGGRKGGGGRNENKRKVSELLTYFLALLLSMMILFLMRWKRDRWGKYSISIYNILTQKE